MLVGLELEDSFESFCAYETLPSQLFLLRRQLFFSPFMVLRVGLMDSAKKSLIVGISDPHGTHGL